MSKALLSLFKKNKESNYSKIYPITSSEERKLSNERRAKENLLHQLNEQQRLSNERRAREQGIYNQLLETKQVEIKPKQAWQKPSSRQGDLVVISPKSRPKVGGKKSKKAKK